MFNTKHSKRKLALFTKIVLTHHKDIAHKQKGFCIYTDLPDGRHWFQGVANHPKLKGLIMNFFSPWINDAMPMTLGCAHDLLTLLDDKAALIQTKEAALDYWYSNPYNPAKTAEIPKLDYSGITNDPERMEKAIEDGAEFIEDPESDLKDLLN